MIAHRSLSAITVVATLALSAPAQSQTVGVTDNEILIGALGVLTGPLYMNGKTIYDGV